MKNNLFQIIPFFKTVSKKNVFNLLLFFIAFCSIISCNENSTDAPAKLNILATSATAVFVGDTITVWGGGFGNDKLVAFIHLDTNITISADSIISWNESMFRFRVPKCAASGKLFVTVDADTSNAVSLTVSKVRPFVTVDIPAGSFDMGSSFGYEDESPLHKVEITQPFIIAAYETTQQLYESVTGDNPSTQKGDLLPVTNITFLAAVDFCNKLSAIETLEPYYYFENDTVKVHVGANGWRLPTEAEWEYVCRSGSTSDFTGGNSPDEYGWYNSNSGMMIQRVGLKRANAFGVFDMHGNAREWTFDWYARDYYSTSPKSDPQGPATGLTRVMRGGSYRDGKDYLRSSSRMMPDAEIDATGFRIARKK